MTSLWCHHVAFRGQWVPGNGFNRVLSSPFHNMTDLGAQIAASNAPGSIRHLAIIVHGEEGELKTGSDNTNLVTPERIENDRTLQDVLRDLGQYLAPNATVSFYSCSAAASSRGSELLKSLSRLWPGCAVVASITKGYIHGTLTAGAVLDTLLTVILNHEDRFFIPGAEPGRRGEFFLPARLPPFLTLRSTRKVAKNGRLKDMPSGPRAFRQFELHYPIDGRNTILEHPLKFRCASDSEFYTRYLINIDWPHRNGADELIRIGNNYEFRQFWSRADTRAPILGMDRPGRETRLRELEMTAGSPLVYRTPGPLRQA